MAAMITPENWEGDGFPEHRCTDEDILCVLDDLGFTYPEVEAMYEACKREAWVYEKMGNHTHDEDYLVMARFFWRRAERLRVLAKKMREE